MEALRNDKRYTYADYASWDTEDRYELINGAPYLMAAPSDAHQRINGNLFVQFHNFLKGKPCKIRISPYDVRLNADAGDDVVVQPDIVIICDSTKISEKGCTGAPDLIVEILSPTSAGRDKLLKFNQYLKAGVREYWIIEPESKTVQAFILENGRYIATSYGETDTVPVQILEDCEISLPDVFNED
jgi:Uma2 family endonuclease